MNGLPSPVLARLLVTLISVVAGVHTAGAEQRPAISGPITGYIYDRFSTGVHRVIGVPGSAWLGAPVIDNVQSFSSSPDGRVFLIVREGLVLAMSGDNVVPVEVESPGPDIASARWSDDGQTAVAWSSDKVHLLRYEAGVIRLVRTSVIARSPERIVSAIASAGGHILVSTAQDDSGAIFFVSEGEPRLLLRTRSPAAIAGAGDRAYAADASGQRVLRVTLTDGRVDTLLEAGNGLADPVAIEVSADGTWLYVVNRSEPALHVYDIGQRAVSRTVALDFGPCALEKMRNSRYIVLSPCSDTAPVSIVQDGMRPVVWFVPRAGQQ